jgi:hypothetical protein
MYIYPFLSYMGVMVTKRGTAPLEELEIIRVLFKLFSYEKEHTKGA